jgi:hypothetical protein
MATIPDPRYVVLTAAGFGGVAFRGARSTMRSLVQKITVESGATGSGVVSIRFRGQLISSKPLALQMSADGAPLEVHAGEEINVIIEAGPAGAEIKIVFHYEEVPL